jgi:NAD(P) transhydrogenase subunit beta
MEQYIFYLRDLAYLVASGLFIFGLKRLSRPDTAATGNRMAAFGMLIAVVATLSNQGLNYGLIIGGIVIGGALGMRLAQRIQMTQMPQLVGVFNGLGGAASALVAVAEFLRLSGGGDVTGLTLTTIIVSSVIGTLTLSGSFIAVGKLQGFLTSKPIALPMQQGVDIIILLGIVALGIWLAMSGNIALFFVILGIAFLLGIMLVMPIGGADMPVVISLLNSYSGLAAAATGFVLDNNGLIISGALVGASGLILTSMMCKAMNRSLLNVMFAGVGGEVAAGGASGASMEGKSIREISPDDAAIVMANAQSVIIAPGYGLAVAQAQHEVSELANQLQARGVDVKYAIHPVAGRMPGHMNVLLAEANVPYDQLYDMDDINREFDNTDVVLIIGANDVVNPAARHDKSSPIYGMPILDVDKAHNVIVNKRSMNPGFAGIENELFFGDNTFMLFGDAKAAMASLNREVKEV